MFSERKKGTKMKKKPNQSDSNRDRSEGENDDDESTNDHDSERQEESARNHHRRDSASSQEGCIDSPSFTSSFESRSSSTSRGGGTGGNDRRLIESHEGKIRPSTSRDTVSTTSLSHFDGNSSTGVISHSEPGPLGQHRRGRRGRRPPSSSLYNRQLNILMSSTGISLVLFLFFFLNIFAFTALMSFAFSAFMLVYTSYAYIIYLIQSGELNIFSLLPESTRNRFLNTSIHDILTDNTGYMENRFLLLYFIPGLSPEQILGMVNRLPQRHRDLVLGPGGIARILLQPSINNRIGNSNAAQTASGTTQALSSTQQLVLPVIEEENETFSLADEEEVTNRDALQGIFSTARSLITGSGEDDHDSVEEESLYVNVNVNTSDDNQRVEFRDLSWDDAANREENEVRSRNSDSDSGESDLGLEISSDDFTGNLPHGQLNRIARMIGLQSSTPSLPSSPPTTVTARPMITEDHHEGGMPLSPSSSEDSANSQVLEEERNLEGEIINEAVSAMFNNYYDAAIQGMTEVAANVADNVAPTIIRAGVRASSLSGLGLLGMFSSRMLTVQQSAMMRRSVSGRNLADSGAGRFAIRGLFSTLVIGMVSAGSAYLTRAFLRRRQRDLMLSSAKKNQDESQDKAEKKE